MSALNHILTVLIVMVGFSPAHGQWAEINKSAPQVGNINLLLKGEPESLHPIMAGDLYSQKVHAYTLESLMTRDFNTYEWKPVLIERYEISKDHKTFTLFLKKGVLFHDGKEMTAEDVKFSFDAIFEPKHRAFNLQPYYDGIAKVEVVDPYTVKVTTKDTYFRNFDSIAGLSIIPKHVYGDPDKSIKLNRTIVSTAPYLIEKYDRGQRLVLKKFDKWHGKSDEKLKGMYNFQNVTFRFIKDDQIGLEYLKKGDIDYMEIVSAEDYATKTKGPPWGTSVLKVAANHNFPKSYGFVAFNFRNPLFQDKNVRLALAHLFNRELLNEKFNYGMSYLATGPWYLKSEYASPNVKPINFDTKKASELLKKAGWADADKNGILERTVNGKKEEFRFSIMHSNKDREKYFTMWKEDLKKAGIELDIKYVEWQSFSKFMDEAKFDTAAMAWGAGAVDVDPKQIWHSSSARNGGSNYINYNNPKVDALIDKARYENNKPKRVKMMREIYETIAADVPYIFLFNNKFEFYGVRDRIKRPGDTFQYDIGKEYWWVEK